MSSLVAETQTRLKTPASMMRAFRVEIARVQTLFCVCAYGSGYPHPCFPCRHLPLSLGVAHDLLQSNPK
eukprot:1532743-Rhodomonas_salina.1